MVWSKRFGIVVYITYICFMDNELPEIFLGYGRRKPTRMEKKVMNKLIERYSDVPIVDLMTIFKYKK